jgi:hypothetical protein
MDEWLSLFKVGRVIEPKVKTLGKVTIEKLMRNWLLCGVGFST